MEDFKIGKQTSEGETDQNLGFSRAMASWSAAVLVAITPAESLMRAASCRLQLKMMYLGTHFHSSLLS